jgi:predicted acetylornithine/succinylornithine family transaminase
MNIKDTFKKFVLNTYTRVGPVFVKGKGSWLWDDKGKKYLDLFPGWGVSILGHCPQAVIKVIASQSKKLIHLPNNLYFKEQAALAKEIVGLSFPSKIFFANSGAEAVEGALKLSRLFGKSKGKYELVTMKNSFHGRTFGAMSVTGQAKYKKPFVPILPQFKGARFNDIKDVKSKLNKKTVGIILELIQGEGGVNIADKKFVKELRSICKKKNLLLIVDEVQTGMGRTGTMFAYQQYGITPDIMVLSKGLGAGVPISALVVHKKIADIIKPGMHASTFGGSPLVTAASKEVFRAIKKEKLLNNVKKMSAYLSKRLSVMKKEFSKIKEIRIKGIMVGVELKCSAQPIVEAALAKGLVINATHGNVVRIMPALNVTKSELKKGLDILEKVFKEKLG